MKQPSAPMTPEQQAEQVRQFDSVFGDVPKTMRWTLKGHWTFKSKIVGLKKVKI